MIHDEQSALAWLARLPEYDSAAEDRLRRLVSLLIVENERQNLIAKATVPDMWRRHIVDSAQLLAHVPRKTSLATWLDLGTGAGFPGLVIAALRPDVDVVMVESRARRIDWLQRACASLDLTKAQVAGNRLEHMPEGKFDVISARAFAPLQQLLTTSTRFSTSATIWLLPKGRSAAQELAQLQGWNHLFHVEPSLTDSEAGIVVGTLSGRKGAP